LLPAFCGFFVAGSNAKLTNNASQVALLRKGNRTVMTMSNDYQGPPENFALVVPVPVVLKKDDVKTLPANVFDKVDSLTAPRLVEYWERDPCEPRVMYEADGFALRKMASGGRPAAAPAGLGVTVEAQFVVGEYEIVILSAQESTGLDRWLRLNRYNIPAGADVALAPYVREGSKFFVAKVDVAKVKRNAQGVIQLSPLRFSYEANELRLPVRLGLLNSAGKQDLIVYVLHPNARFEAANYPNAFIPTNLEVADEVRNDFAAFYATLFDATMEKMGRKAIVTEYAWQTSSCDPCPTPPLQPSDVATLGDDVSSGGAPGRRGFSPYVVTRLHTRYSKETLSEDIVFREAKPVLGGRASRNGASSDAGAQVTDAGVNNFQGRYIIRHYWTGPVACKNPVWNEWGGPPGGGGTPAIAAKGLALAPRGKTVLTRAVRSPVPLLGLPGQPPRRRNAR
jgi:hypothetical protein